MVKATQFPAKAASLKIVGLGLLGLTCPMPTGPTGPRPTMTGSFLAFPLFVSVAGISHVAGIASVGRAWLAQPELAWACQLGLPQPASWRDASWQAESLAVLAVCGWLVKFGLLAAVEGGNCFPLTTFSLEMRRYIIDLSCSILAIILINYSENSSDFLKIPN